MITMANEMPWLDDTQVVFGIGEAGTEGLDGIDILGSLTQDGVTDYVIRIDECRIYTPPT
jgi:hypothetical protein